MIARVLGAVGLLLVMTGGAEAVRAQDSSSRAIERPDAPPAQRGRPCDVVITGVTRNGVLTTHTQSFTTGNGGRNIYIGGGVDATCAGQGNRLLADSAEHFTERGLLILYQNVRYTEPRITINSDRMFYYTSEERLVADGNVRGRTASGTRFTGPQFEYFRERPGIRALSRWVATGRPFMRMSPTETGAPTTATDSVDLTANRVVSVNDSLVWASGVVVIERSDMVSTGDSATLDNGTEFARLMREPKIVGKGERPFTLVGTVIDLWSEQRKLERVVAAGNASVVSDSLTLAGDTVDLRFVDQEIARVMTWGGRARADAPAQQIEADSMDILMPGQQLQELRAHGAARAHSRVDTSRVVTDERDWIAGDTLIAHFETVLDSARGAETTRMREVVATGEARAFYQLAPSGGVRGAPNLSYNRGRMITVLFADGQMSTVTVSERASGLYLERAVPVDTTTPPAVPPRPTP